MSRSWIIKPHDCNCVRHTVCEWPVVEYTHVGRPALLGDAVGDLAMAMTVGISTSALKWLRDAAL
jgi:hypothetical protein